MAYQEVNLINLHNVIDMAYQVVYCGKIGNQVNFHNAIHMSYQ